MSGRRPVLAIVGATGAVGTVMRSIVSERADLWGEVRLIASARSAGRKLEVRGRDVVVQALTPDVFDGVDLAMFDVPDEVSREWAPVAAARGVVVIDKSGAFRMNSDVPLVVPEVNPAAAADRPLGIISVPNCTTLALIVAVGALHRAFGLRELVAASYQAASGAGQAGIDALYDQVTKAAGNLTLGQRPGDVRAALGDGGPFGAPLALNVVPWAGSLRDEGWSSEELKIRNETRKILGLPDLRITATCVRVPVIVGHSLALHAIFERPVSRAAGAAGAAARRRASCWWTTRSRGQYPTPADVAGTDPTLVGRVRQSLDEPCAIDMFVSGDNLRKGAALNAAQIAELLAPELAATTDGAPAAPFLQPAA